MNASPDAGTRRKPSGSSTKLGPAAAAGVPGWPAHWDCWTAQGVPHSTRE
jgi:hypothetical protein